MYLVSRCTLVSLCLCASVVLFPGCTGGKREPAAPRVRTPMRAIWVVRSDYKSPQDVTAIMENCRDAGFNTVIFQVRGNGTVFYPSKLEPWADELGGTDPGWDPLDTAIREAHARGLELHAWVNVMPAWRGPQPPANPEQLYNKHPEWFWYDQAGNRQPLVHGDRNEGWYVSVNPCLPEVRDYLVQVLAELAANYEIDGLHMDYIRFPNEPVVRGEKIPDYPRDARTLELFAADVGATPDEAPDAWTAWRCEQVTQLVTDIRDMLRRTRPAAALTASVGTSRSLAHFRDDRRWARERLVDAVFPMNYVDEPAVFGERVDNWLADQPPVPVVPGLWFGRHPGKSPEEAAEAVRQQIALAHEKTGNFCVFSYAGLFGERERGGRRRGSETGQAAQVPTTQRSSRVVRREVLLPFLRSLAEAPAGV